MVGVFLMVGLAVRASVDLVAARAAAAAAERGLQIAQTPGGSDAEAEDVVTRLTRGSGFVTATDLTITRTPGTVTVDVRVRTVLEGSVSRRVAGPMLRFVEQSERG
jgi:multisubunit Na+/H+ antiporter MnhE subunit